MLEVHYGKTKAKLAALCVVVLYLMDLPELLTGIYDAAVSITKMERLGIAAALFPLILTYVLPVLSRLVFMLYYLKLLVAVPRNHRKGMLVLVSANLGFSAANLLVAAMVGGAGGAGTVMALLQLCISPSAVLLLGLLTRRGTEWIAAAARLLALGIAVGSMLLAGMRPSATVLLSAGLYIAVLLLHPVLSRPILERPVPQNWELQGKPEDKKR